MANLTLKTPKDKRKDNEVTAIRPAGTQQQLGAKTAPAPAVK